jgi:hypothetical protein
MGRMELDAEAFLLKTVRFVADMTASPPSLLTTRVNEVLTLMKNGQASVFPRPDLFPKHTVNSALVLRMGNKEETFMLQCRKGLVVFESRGEARPAVYRWHGAS